MLLMLLYLSLVTILLTILLAIKYGPINRTALYLFGAFVCFALYELSHYFIVYSKSAFAIAIFYNHFSFLNLLIGPLLFFYVRGTITDRISLKKTDLFHFFPAILHLLGTIPWFFKSFPEKYNIALSIVNNIDVMKSLHPNIFFTVQGAFVLRPVSILVYVLYSFYIIWKYAPTVHLVKKVPQRQLVITYRWLITLLISFFLLILNYGYLVVYYLDFNGTQSSHLVHNLQSICGGILIVLTLLLFVYPRVLLGFPVYHKSQAALVPEIQQEIVQDIPSEILEEEVAEPFVRMAEQIDKIFTEDKRVIEGEFSLEDLAKTLDQPVHHVSYCINHVMLTKFTDLRLKHRITYAKKLLLDSSNQNYTIETIAKQAGFKTRSNFYNAFKQITGNTPTEFIKLNGGKVEGEQTV